jgi:hypothetical protein
MNNPANLSATGLEILSDMLAPAAAPAEVHPAEESGVALSAGAAYRAVRASTPIESPKFAVSSIRAQIPPLPTRDQSARVLQVAEQRLMPCCMRFDTASAVCRVLPLALPPHRVRV